MFKNAKRVFCMLSLLTAVCGYAADNAAGEPQIKADKEILIWGDNVPGPKIEGIAERVEYRKNPNLPIDRAIYSVSVPRMEMFVPKAEKRTKTAVIVCPGGGYNGIVVDKEGYSTAKWLNSIGVTAFVLKYRLKEYGYPWPIADLQQAIRVVRTRADEFGVAADKIGVAGFSAGGHLASSGSVHWQHDFLKDAPATDNLRPDFSILAYPVISFQPEIGHNGSKINMLGENPDQKMVDMLSNELHIDAKTPPAFLFHAQDDKVVPVENSILYYQAMVKADVNGQLHIFSKGGHGFATAPTNESLSIWMKLCENWLKNSGFLE